MHVEGGLAGVSFGVPNMVASVRAERTGAVTLAFALTACAHAPPPASVPDPEIAQLRQVLAAREQTIAELEGQLALRAAPKVDATPALAQVEAPSPPPQAAAKVQEPALWDNSADARISDGPRPLLRLHEGRPEASGVWTVPTTSERLGVAPVPMLPDQVPTPAEAAQDLYVRALDLVRRREFPEALRELDAFLSAFPDDARVVRATFWRGEVLFAQRRYAEALSAFEIVLAREPHGEMVPDVLLRLARCSLRLGAAERARALLAQLAAEYPNSEAARLVRQDQQQEDG